jgi:hypothetical protein
MKRLGFGELIEQHLTDGRGKNTQLPLADLDIQPTGGLARIIHKVWF